MAAKPWKTTDELVDAVKLKILMPTYQSVFTPDGIIQFLNDEMKSSQIPSVMSLHESFFVHNVEVLLERNKTRYLIPNRAIGMKLNDLSWKDENGNLSEMTRISDGDKSYFQSNIGLGGPFHKFYLEGNYVVLSSNDTINFNPTGYLVFSIFLRPNELVPNNRAAIIQSFFRNVIVSNASLAAGDTITILDEIFTAVSGAPGINEFQIGGTSIITATNLASAINLNGITTADNGSPSTAIVLVNFDLLRDAEDEISSDSTGLEVSENIGVLVDQVPDNIIDGTLIDFLQTNPGHQVYDFDILPVSITSMMMEFDPDDMPEDLVIGDYICEAHECIIPGIPPDLHNLLAERASAEILKSLGDQQGLQASKESIAEKIKSQGTLIDNRVENAPQKINSRHSLLGYGRRRNRWGR